MAASKFTLDSTILVLVDLQPNFLKVISQRDAIVGRAMFLLRACRELGVPALATTQYASRMGAALEDIAPLLSEPPMDKLTFSCIGAPGFQGALRKYRRRHVLLCGIETHICVTQTALDVQDLGYEPAVAVDATGSRGGESHAIGIERLRSAGVQMVHSESVVYELMKTAEHPKFKQVLELVKASDTAPVRQGEGF